MNEKPLSKRRNHSSDFKIKVALEAIRERRTLNEIASEYGVHATQVSEWKKQVLEALPEALKKNRGRAKESQQTQEATLYEEIGRLKVENGFLKKKYGSLV